MYETTRKEMIVDDVGAGDEEVELIRQRDEIFADFRDALLREVLDIANDAQLKNALKS